MYGKTAEIAVSKQPKNPQEMHGRGETATMMGSSPTDSNSKSEEHLPSSSALDALEVLAATASGAANAPIAARSHKEDRDRKHRRFRDGSSGSKRTRHGKDIRVNDLYKHCKEVKCSIAEEKPVETEASSRNENGGSPEADHLSGLEGQEENSNAELRKGKWTVSHVSDQQFH